MRYLGIDYGTKKTGLALSDEKGTMGFPYSVVPAADLKDFLTKLFKEEQIDAVVVGESKDLSGEDNPIAEEARAFAEWVHTQFTVPVHFEPEMYTSAEARRTPHKEMKTRSPKRHDPVDASAAALILTSYLSHTHHE